MGVEFLGIAVIDFVGSGFLTAAVFLERIGISWLGSLRIEIVLAAGQPSLRIGLPGLLPPSGRYKHKYDEDLANVSHDGTLAMSYKLVHMAIFQRFALGLLIVLGPSASWACEEILRSSPHLIAPQRLILPPRAARVKELAADGLFLSVREKNDTFWTVVFDKDDDHRNAGYFVAGKVRPDVYVGFITRRSRRDDELDYYREVAHLHRLKNQTLHLSRAHAGCNSVEIKGWVEAKLFLKHGLKLQDVKALLETAEIERIFDSGNRDRRYRVKAVDPSGRAFLIVIAEKESCPNVLITAYAESEEN